MRDTHGCDRGHAEACSDAWDSLRGQYKAERRALKEARSRCFTPTNKDFTAYGGRGITVCPTWLGHRGFVRFLAHVGPKPSKHHSLDRIDNHGNYEPGNVRWVDRRVQANNRRSSRLVRWGDEVMTCAELARYFEVPRQDIVAFADAGWFPVDPLEHALLGALAGISKGTMAKYRRSQESA